MDDDRADLMAEARRLTGIADDAELVGEALRALIQREGARRLMALGGTEPDLRPIPRRRFGPDGRLESDVTDQGSTSDS